MPGKRTIKNGAEWISSQQGKHFCHCGCGSPIKIQIHHHARGIAKFIDGHSSRVNNPMSGRSGNLNPHYNSGVYINLQGYVLVLIPGPGRSRYALEHRMVAEKIIGRPLTEYEVVHHKNGLKTDNRPENIEVMSNSSHTSYHALKGEVGFRKWKGKYAKRSTVHDNSGHEGNPTV